MTCLGLAAIYVHQDIPRTCLECDVLVAKEVSMNQFLDSNRHPLRCLGIDPFSTTPNAGIKRYTH